MMSGIKCFLVKVFKPPPLSEKPRPKIKKKHYCFKYHFLYFSWHNEQNSIFVLCIKSVESTLYILFIEA